jgi:predicted  nucleic acid-binding Zn-ribbon protein
MRSLGGNIISSFDLRINGIGGIKETVRTDLGEAQNFLKQLEDSRESTAKELRTDLDQHTADLKESVASEMKGFEDARTDIAKELQHEARELQGELQKSKAHLQHSVGALLKGFDVELGEMRTTLDGGQDEWRKLVSTMHAKRSGATVAKPPKAAKTTEFTAETTPDFARPPKAGAKREGSKKVKAGKGKAH